MEKVEKDEKKSLQQSAFSLQKYSKTFMKKNVKSISGT